MEEIVADKSSSDVKETSGKNASPSLSSDFLNTSAIDIVPAKSCNDVQETDDNGSPSETAESVECKNCPEAITEYLQHFTYQAERRKTLLELTTNARKQLLSTGWKIRSEMRKGSLQATFTFPEKIGYYSLEEACLGCFSDKQNCPEAITKYRRFLLTSHSAGRKSLSVLSSNAQRYLSSAGWTIFYKSKPRNRFGKKIPDRFTSPQWKNYFSLSQACKAVRDDAAPQQSSKPANSEPKRRMSPDGTSSKGFSSSHEDVNDEFFNVLKDFQQHEVAQGGGEPSKEDDNVPEVSPNCQVSASSEDEWEEDSHEHREKKTNSVDDFVYHPEAADELLLDPSWLPPPPAMLSEAMDLQHTSANQMAALHTSANQMAALVRLGITLHIQKTGCIRSFA